MSNDMIDSFNGMDAKSPESGTHVIKPKLECTKLESIPEMTDPNLTWTPSSSPKAHGSPVVAIRSRSLPDPLGTRLPPPGTPACTGSPTCTGSSMYARSPRGSDRDIKIIVLGYFGVGKSALVVRYLTKRFIGDYAAYETMCTAETAVDYKKVKLSILDMSWKGSGLDELDRYLDWCDGALFLFSLVDPDSFREIDKLCAQFDSKLKKLAAVLVGTKSDLSYARKVSQTDVQSLMNRTKCPYVETSARESHASCAQAFVTLIQETRNTKSKKKERRNANKNGYSSKLQNIRDRLRYIAGEFRQRTNTF